MLQALTGQFRDRHEVGKFIRCIKLSLRLVLPFAQQIRKFPVVLKAIFSLRHITYPQQLSNIYNVFISPIGCHRWSRRNHFDNPRFQKIGITLLILYCIQLLLGAVIHFLKMPPSILGGHRPPQNYFHAVLGLVIIALAFYQVCALLSLVKPTEPTSF